MCERWLSVCNSKQLRLTLYALVPSHRQLPSVVAEADAVSDAGTRSHTHTLPSIRCSIFFPAVGSGPSSLLSSLPVTHAVSHTNPSSWCQCRGNGSRKRGRLKRVKVIHSRSFRLSRCLYSWSLRPRLYTGERESVDSIFSLALPLTLAEAVQQQQQQCIPSTDPMNCLHGARQ